MLTDKQKAQLMRDVTLKVLEAARLKKMDKFEIAHLSRLEIENWLKERGLYQDEE